MNPLELERMENYYNLHPESVLLTIVSSGQTCKGIFDYSYTPEGRDKAGVLLQTLYAHFTCYIGNAAFFTDKRGQDIEIEFQGSTKAFKQVSSEILDTQGAVQIWLV